MVYLTRKEHFNAAHLMYVTGWSEEKNFEYFGKCANKNYHGHNYNVYITVKGKPDEETGFIMNVKELSKIIKKEVSERLDHRNLNEDVPEFKHLLPSTENVCIQIWKWLEPHITGCQLHCIRLYETENIYTEYYGE